MNFQEEVQMGAATFLVIAVLVNGELKTESAYAMESLAECEAVSQHMAVLDSYPDRKLFCVETSTSIRSGDVVFHFPFPAGNPGAVKSAPPPPASPSAPR